MEVTHELLAQALKQYNLTDTELGAADIMADMQRILDERGKWLPNTLYSRFDKPGQLPAVFWRTANGWYSYATNKSYSDGMLDTKDLVPCGRMGRGSDVEQWLVNQRAAHQHADPDVYGAIDDLVDDYRLHCDTGTPLTKPAHGC